MLRKLMIGIFTAVFALGLAGCSGQSDYSEQFQLSKKSRNQDKLTLKFGRVPSVTVTELLRENAPLIRLLKSKLDVNITYRFADTYQGIIQGMSEENYDFTWMGPYSYVLSECATKTSASYKPLVRPLRKNEAGELSGEYRGIIFTRPNTQVKTLEDLKGKSFAFTEKLSTSGYLFPKASMVDAGLDPGRDLSESGFLKRHDKVVRAVREGSFAAGATYNDARMVEYSSKKMANEELPIIEKTKPIPTSPITVSKSFAKNHPELVKDFVNVMTRLHESKEGRKILDTLGIARYKSAENSDYDQVRNVLRMLGSNVSRVETICSKSFS